MNVSLDMRIPTNIEVHALNKTAIHTGTPVYRQLLDDYDSPSTVMKEISPFTPSAPEPDSDEEFVSPSALIAPASTAFRERRMTKTPQKQEETPKESNRTSVLDPSKVRQNRQMLHAALNMRKSGKPLVFIHNSCIRS